MTERALYDLTIRALFVAAAVVAPALLFLVAPYGRHAERTRGRALPARVGWLVMESPSVLVPLACFAIAPPRTPTPWVLLALWQVHYVHRALVYPFRLRPGAKPMPVAICAGAFLFTTVNGYLNGRWLTPFGDYPTAWLASPRFLVGAALFLVGYAINQQADRILLRLRAPGETGYKIPTGGLYRFVSCPNYLGEIVEWCGWAACTWSLAGLAFALFTVANLAPRALAHHRWYRGKFPDYPTDRRALVPFVL